MKYNEFIEMVLEMFKDTDYISSLNITFGKLRIAGLLYDKYMYRKEYKTLEKVYSPEQVIYAIESSFEFINNADKSKFTNEQHKVNFVINSIQRSLKLMVDSQEDDLQDILNEDI